MGREVGQEKWKWSEPTLGIRPKTLRKIEKAFQFPDFNV
jgi:hypothetical protein